VRPSPDTRIWRISIAESTSDDLDLDIVVDFTNIMKISSKYCIVALEFENCNINVSNWRKNINELIFDFFF
jgi:hypothetical protein